MQRRTEISRPWSAPPVCGTLSVPAVVVQQFGFGLGHAQHLAVIVAVDGEALQVVQGELGGQNDVRAARDHRQRDGAERQDHQGGCRKRRQAGAPPEIDDGRPVPRPAWRRCGCAARAGRRRPPPGRGAPSPGASAAAPAAPGRTPRRWPRGPSPGPARPRTRPRRRRPPGGARNGSQFGFDHHTATRLDALVTGSVQPAPPAGRRGVAGGPGTGATSPSRSGTSRAVAIS